MPIRMLRDWTDSERVNALSAAAEVFFVRLIMKADDYGCFHGNERLVKSLLFPLKDGTRDAEVVRWIAECVKSGLIRVYESEGKKYLHILNFGQRMKASRRKFPAPPDTSGNFPELSGTSRLNRIESGNGKRENETGNTPSIPEAEVQGDAPVPPASAGGVGADEEAKPCRVFSGFPKSKAEVLDLAERVGAVCSDEQAEAYLLSRQSVNWIKPGNVPVRNVGADLKSYLFTWRQNRADADKREAARRRGAENIDRAEIDRKKAEHEKKLRAEYGDAEYERMKRECEL